MIEAVTALLIGDQINSSTKESIVRENRTYLNNQWSRMNYHKLRRVNLPIGLGPVEAGCKTLIKSRFSGSGMRWLIAGADDVLIIRSQALTDGRLDQYWRKRMRNLNLASLL